MRDELQRLLDGDLLHEAQHLFDRACSQDAALAADAARLAYKRGQPRLAVRWFRRASELAPADPELRHERGLAHLEAGEIGLAALAQGEALSIDPGHTGARAQRAAALEGLGDDEGAARELQELLLRIGPQPALAARLAGLRAAAARAAHGRIVGAPVDRLRASPLTGTAFSRTAQPHVFRALFATLTATAAGQRVERLDLVFDSMDASLGRTDLTFGGTTEDENGRRVPLDEFTSAAVVFLSEALGMEPLRARRLLSFLLTPECGMGPHRLGGCSIGWTVDGEGTDRRYGLYASA